MLGIWSEEERQEVAETRIALQETISKVELEPGSTQVKIHYAIPVVSAFLLTQPRYLCQGNSGVPTGIRTPVPTVKG